MENKEILLSILEELKKSNERERTPYYKEWFPFVFHIYMAGKYVRDPTFGTNKWGFNKIENKDLHYDFPYEFHSLKLYTEYNQYKPAIRLIVNGTVYPTKQVLLSNYSTYDDWQEFVGHNYNYQRAYMFWSRQGMQSGHGYADYPFKMVVPANWTLNFSFFMTSTSAQWHQLEIMGWKLHYKSVDYIQELEEAII